MENSRIAALIDEIADLLELKQDNEFRIRSYRSAAQTIRGLTEPVEVMAAADNPLTDLPHIGDRIADKIREILKTGTCRRLEELRGAVPRSLVDLIHVPHVGPRTAMLLNRKLGIQGLDDLKKACLEHRVAAVKHLGEKSEKNILAGIASLQKPGRILYTEAEEILESLRRHLDRIKVVTRWSAAGSFRRGAETIGDLDLLVQATDRDKAASEILAYAEVEELLDRGPEKLSVRLKGGLRVDFRFQGPEAFGSALLYFTGCKSHNIKLRHLAQERRWKLNEYGLYAGRRRLAGETEEGVHNRLGLSWIPPELREDRGEIEAAREGTLPALIEASDIRGDFHVHTKVTDGNDSIADMATAAKALGWSYLAITDHSKRVAMARGLDDDAALRHADDVRRVGAGLPGFWLMTGIEVDILKDGRLDLKETTLSKLDWVVASAHYDHAMSRDAMTRRLVAAIGSGVVHCLGHPLNRLIGSRAALDFDLDKVIEACLANHVRLEINCQPNRLDLPDNLCQHAREAGVSFALATDAHSVTQLAHMRLGVMVARRGWLTAADVLNTRPLPRLRKELASRGTERLPALAGAR